ncbi:MAG: hypothetical protein ACLU79_15910 [Clostridium sp.]|jgi:hypothetical protein
MNKENEKYLNILKRYNKELWAVAVWQEQQHQYDSIERVMAQVGGVSIYLYILWVIQEAKKRNIKRLYFLARDGQIFFKVAKIICKKKNIDIECRYLYCSRIAWRIPQYFLMQEKCLDYICQRSMNLNINKMFERTSLAEEQIQQFCELLNIEEKDRERLLNYNEANIIKEKLRKSRIFLETVYEKSKIEYANTIQYLQQEGLTDNEHFAIVDTGWVGSMQESLSELLSYYKKKPIVTEGFYVGLFQTPKDSFQKYYPYLFSSNRGLWEKVRFNNNLLECMCGATDGMTVGYEKVNNIWKPRFASVHNLNSDRWDIEANHALVVQYAECMCCSNTIFDITYRESKKITGKLMEAFMMHPTKDEAESYGRYLFSDDMTEKGVLELAPSLEKLELFGEDFIPKILKRLFIKDIMKKQTKSYWIEGSIKRSGTKLEKWHNFNSLLWHILQFGSM